MNTLGECKARRPSFLHYLLCKVVDLWTRHMQEMGYGEDVSKNNPVFLKPVVLLTADELRRAGVPVWVDAYFKEPTTHLSLDLVESMAIEQALRQCLQADWIRPPALSWTSYRLTPEGWHMLEAEAGLAEAYEAMWRAGQQQLAVEPSGGRGRDAPVTPGILDEVLNRVLTMVAGMPVAELRSRLLTQANKILVEGTFNPYYRFDPSYQAVVDLKDRSGSEARGVTPKSALWPTKGRSQKWPH